MYLGNIDAARQIFRHTLHDRAGEPQLTRRPAGADSATSAWARVTTNQDIYGILDAVLADTHASTMQVGASLLRWSQRGRSEFGVMLGKGRSSTSVRSALSGYRAAGRVEGDSIGVQGTWHADAARQRGAYLDSWLIYGRFRNDVQGQWLAPERYRARGRSASLEAGYGLAVFDDGRRRLFIEPQAQLIHDDFSQDRQVEQNGTPVAAGASGYSARLGGRIYGHALHASNRVQPFVTLDAWRRGGAGWVDMGGARVRSGLPRELYQASVGAQLQLGRAWTGWGQGSVATGPAGFRDVGGQIGIKYQW